MAGHRALAAAGRSIVDLLNCRFEEQFPSRPRPTAVLAGTADFDRVNSSPVSVIRFPAVSVSFSPFCVNHETRPGWSAVSSVDGVSRTPLRMHFLVAAWDTFVESELELLGLAVQTLERDSILTGPMLHPSGEWQHGDAVQVVSDDLPLDSMSEAFEALTTKYRLSLPYVARVIRIDGRKQAEGEAVASVGVAS
jgi:Pvc16 N-terminal domain